MEEHALPSRNTSILSLLLEAAVDLLKITPRILLKNTARKKLLELPKT